MIELDGVEYVVKTPAENTQDLVDYVNQYCANNDVRNTDNEVIFVEVNIASPIYLLFWAVGYMVTVVQKLLYSIGRQYSIAASSEKQLLNIASNAGIRRRQPTYTTIRALVFAGEDGACTIDTNLGATITVEGKSYRFKPTFTKVIAAGENSVIILAADTLGALQLNANTITRFDSNVPNFGHMTTSEALPGRDLETLPTLRRRIQRRQDATSSLDRLIQALRGLQGVTACNVFYNTNPTEPIVIGSLSIPARNTAVFVQGYNENIASTYFSYTDRPCVDAAGSITQNFQLLNGQTFPVYILPPATRPVYVQVFTTEEVSDAVKRQIREAIISISMDIDIGDRLTTAQILEKMVVSYKVMGVLVSFEEESGFSYAVTPAPNEIVTFKAENMTVEVGS